MFDRLLLSISRRSRERKYRDFLRLLAIKPEDAILDVGFHNHEYRPVDNYLEKRYSYPEKLTALGIEGKEEFEKKYPTIKAIVYDGRIMPFGDKTFDAAHANAVLEHVGSEENQVLFIKELNRIAKNVFMTVPNGGFPIEVHTHVPLLHWFLPKSWYDRCLQALGKGWAAGTYMDVLRKRDVVRMLDKAGISCYRLVSNRLLGMPLTYTIVWGKRIM